MGSLRLNTVLFVASLAAFVQMLVACGGSDSSSNQDGNGGSGGSSGATGSADFGQCKGGFEQTGFPSLGVEQCHSHASLSYSDTHEEYVGSLGAEPLTGKGYDIHLTPPSTVLNAKNASLIIYLPSLDEGQYEYRGSDTGCESDCPLSSVNALFGPTDSGFFYDAHSPQGHALVDITGNNGSAIWGELNFTSCTTSDSYPDGSGGISYIYDCSITYHGTFSASIEKNRVNTPAIGYCVTMSDCPPPPADGMNVCLDGICSVDWAAP